MVATRREPGGSHINWAAWSAILVSLLFSIATCIYTFATLASRVEQAESAIADMKVERRELSRDIGDIKVSVKGIETKLAILLPDTLIKPEPRK